MYGESWDKILETKDEYEPLRLVTHVQKIIYFDIIQKKI